MNQPTHRLEVKIDLAGIHGRAVRDVRRVVHLAAIGLSANPPEGQLANLDTRTLHYVFDPPTSSDEIQSFNDEYERWVLEAGFRELAEITSGLLEEAFTVRSYWHLGALQEQAGRVTLADVDNVVTEAGVGFNRLTLPDKLARLRSEGVHSDVDLASMVLSINAVRNCLVHRRGIVGDKDLDSSGSLTLRWLGMSLRVRHASGVIEDAPVPYRTLEGDQLFIQHGPKSRSYRRGERVELSTQTFADVGWTVTLFASDLGKATEECGRRNGVAIGPPSYEQPPRRDA